MKITLRHTNGRFHRWCLAVGRLDIPIWPYRRRRPAILLPNSRLQALRQLLENDRRAS
jgi:hypothetical protein